MCVRNNCGFFSVDPILKSSVEQDCTCKGRQIIIVMCWKLFRCIFDSFFFIVYEECIPFFLPYLFKNSCYSSYPSNIIAMYACNKKTFALKLTCFKLYKTIHFQYFFSFSILWISDRYVPTNLGLNKKELYLLSNV